MIQTLKQFTGGTRLFDSVSALMAKLHIEFDRETAEPIDVAGLYDRPMPRYLTEALECIDKTYFIGVINDRSLAGDKSDDSLDSITVNIRQGGKYDGMFVFACDAKPEANLTRTVASALTRAFNRIAVANPVILIIRQDNMLSMATCERMTYTQEWRQGSGEKLGRVSILRGINCDSPHRGHVDILETLGDKSYPTFEELYKHWMEVFSSELLTKKFYNELSDWYAWAVQVAKFPNDIRTDVDDAKFNHESCIRLITRLIFVWFLKQKHLIPDEFFDEEYIRENLIDNFNPHDRQNLLYNAGESKYYRLILQNLFFAMLNCPIVEEGKTTPNNRRFRGDHQHGFIRDGYNVNNLMRYKAEFAEGGADKFVKLANRCVPFLNGGLFDCLDDKPNGLYYDGFSERRESLEQLFLPDYLFFGEEVGRGIDLSQWYDDIKKKNVSARGIIDILKRYSFTIEENTPYDQEVSLDPELLGKAFENLLAAYNPETKQSARKQTGSFYTPREIVQYMVDESLVAHLKRTCGDESETLYRQLLSYATDDVELSEDKRRSIMHAIYNCRILDPACGSGAFPMGVLQQMVHILKRIDPTNRMWNDMMVDIATEDARKELQKVALGNESERNKIEENRKARLEDIENAFNQSINDPDYARKLYLIEHCIYGVDIQPIATQISKLRFFISLVVDQKPTKDGKTNFGIRPLPNLEAKFVTANTLIPLDRSKNLFTGSEEIRYYEELLQEINHRIFLAKKNTVKKELQQLMRDTRTALAQSLENLGAIGPNGYNQLIGWNMFNQNQSAGFFDPEWMFGVKGGFDIVLGNPPYLRIQGIRESNPEFAEFLSKRYLSATGSFDLYVTFVERGLALINQNGILNFIMPTKWINSAFGKGLRKIVSETQSASQIINFGAYQVFNASTYTGLQWFSPNSKYLKYHELNRDLSSNEELKRYLDSLDDEQVTIVDSKKLTEKQWVLTNNTIAEVLDRLEQHPRRIKDIFDRIFCGLQTSKDDVYFIYDCRGDEKYIVGKSKQLECEVQIEKGLVKPLLKGEDVHRYDTIFTDRNVIFPYKIQNGKALLYTESELSELYPKGYEYLKECEGILRDREHGKLKNDDYWYRYIYPKNLVLFDNEKLVAPEISLGGNFAYDKNGEFYSTTKIYGYIKKDDIKESYKFWMALFNSRLFWFFMQNTGYVLRGGYYTFKTDYINPFPVPSYDVTNRAQSIICNLVDYIIYLKNPANQSVLSHTSNGRIISHISEIIDMIVYELYFEQYMRDNNIDVIHYLQEYPWNNNHVDMSNEIEQFYLWYQKSDNQIRQRIMLLETRSKNMLYLIHSNTTI